MSTDDFLKFLFFSIVLIAIVWFTIFSKISRILSPYLYGFGIIAVIIIFIFIMFNSDGSS